MQTRDEVIALANEAAATLVAAAAGKPRDLARIFLEPLVESQPNVKLPIILGLPQTKQLMAESAVSKSMLRQALTEARKTIRKPKIVDEVRVPPKRRQKAVTPVAEARLAISERLKNVSDSSDLFARGPVRNGPISEL